MTSRFTVDNNGNKVHVGSKVLYQNKIWLLKDIVYLSWSHNQYLTLQDVNNENKKIDFILPENIKVVRL